MPALRNKRYEAFAQELYRGLGLKGLYPRSNSAAYSRAGFTAHKPSAKVQACRLLQACPGIVERVQELMGDVSKEVTPQAIVAELEQARALAEQNGQASAMVAASMGKGKILGLEPPAKSEVGRPGDFSTAKSTKDMAKAELAALGVTDPTDDQVAMAVDAMARFAATCEAIVAQSKSLVQGKAGDIALTQPNHHPAARRH